MSDASPVVKPAKAAGVKTLSQSLHIRLDPADRATLQELATEKGLGPSTLARMWLLERLRQEGRAGQ